MESSVLTQTHAVRAYEHLRRKLISGDFPPGSRLRYGPIGKELGISATPVREAIGQLANEGLVQLVPQLGAVVRQVDRETLTELYELREVLEPYAAARAAERATSQQIEKISEQLERMRRITEQVRQADDQYAGKQLTTEFEKADLTFHMLIIEATGNTTLVRTLGNSHVLTGVFATERHRYNVDVMDATCEDHDRILTGIESRDANVAKQATLDHIHHGLEITLQNINQQQNRWWEKT